VQVALDQIAEQVFECEVEVQELAQSRTRLIELCGRTAYKSEDKITEDSAKKFVLMLTSRGHLSVLEHSNIVLKVEKDPAAQVPGGPDPITFADLLQALTDRVGFHRVFPVDSGSGFVMSGNCRAWTETLDSLNS